MNNALAHLSCLLFACLAPSIFAEVQVVKDSNAPPAIRKELWVLSANWASEIPPQGAVNAPGQMEVLSPGDRISLALAADGADREKLFEGRTLIVRIECGGTVSEDQGLKPIAIRRIKAQGADMALWVLKASGIGESDRARLEQATSVVSLAVFRPSWTAPDVAQAQEVRIQVTVMGGATPEPTLEPVRIKLRPWTDWANDPATEQATLNGHFNQYRDNATGGLLFSMLKGVTAAGSLRAPPVAEYFAISFKRNPAAAAAALTQLPSFSPDMQYATLLVLRLGGTDITRQLQVLPPETQALLRSIGPLEDPPKLLTFTDPVSVQAVRGIGNPMDQCWGAWMASGDPVYLRELVGLLDNAQDFPAFQAWTDAKGGAQGLNSRVARGLAYQIAGWSIGSFQRTDPHVADWLLFWQNDPAFPKSLRKEIESLLTNPAFRRQ